MRIFECLTCHGPMCEPLRLAEYRAAIHRAAGHRVRPLPVPKQQKETTR